MGSTVFPAAASGPTLSEITTAGTSAGWNSTGDSPWTLLQSIQATYATNTLTFSGLSGYKTYKIVIPFINISGSWNGVGLRINGDAGNNYNTYGWYSNGATNTRAWGGQQNMVPFYIAGANNGWFMGEVLVEHANLAGPKTINAVGSATGDSMTLMKANYYTTSTVTSLSIVNPSGGTFGNNNYFFLYGAN